MAEPTAVLEVPLLYPCLGNNVPLYVVNDVEGRIYRKEEQGVQIPDSPDKISSMLLLDETSSLRGAASVSAMDQSSILSTSALADQPWILSVMLSFTRPEPPRMLQLDLGSETSLFGSVVKAQGFGRDSEIVLHLVDQNGVILILELDASTLTPLSMSVLAVADLLHPSMAEVVAPASVRSSMVAFLSSTRLVLSLNPFLLAVHLPTQHIEIWSKSHVAAEMEARRSSISNWMNKGLDLLTGKIQTVVSDMNPTSAVCVMDNDPTQVFTLHSDGMVRRWMLPPDANDDETIKPWEVKDLSTIAHLPRGETWSQASNSTVLCARGYRQVFVLAIHVETNGNPENDRDESDCRLVVLHGDKTRLDGSTETSCEHLHVPPSASSLIGMSFDPHTDRCRLTALYQLQDDEDETRSLFVTYAPSHVSIVSSQPTVDAGEYLLETIADQELARIAKLDFAHVVEQSDQEQSLEQVLKELDARYLQVLFRPAFPRGTGTILPPTATRIRRALSKMIPHYRWNETTQSHLELQVVRAIHEWGVRESRPTFFHMTPVKTPKKARATPGTDMADPGSYYDSLVEDDDAFEAEDVAMEEDDDDTWDHDRQADIQAHQGRWKRLLEEIWREEQVDRKPLCLFVPEMVSDAALVVRPGIVSVLTKVPPSTADSRNSLIGQIDQLAMDVLHAIDDNDDFASQLINVEQTLWDDASSLKMTLQTDRTSACEETMAQLSEEVLATAMISDDDPLFQRVRQVSEEELVVALQKTPLRNHLPGLCLFSMQDGQFSWDDAVLNNHLRMASASVTVRSVESARRLLLGRHLLLSALGSITVADTTLRMYLHTLTVSWAFAQYVPMPFVSSLSTAVVPLHLSDSPEESSTPPLTKRPSFGSGASSLLVSLGIRDKTTALDSLLISRLQRIRDSQATKSFSGQVAVLADTAISTSIRFTVDFFVGEDFAFAQLPELGMLSPTSSEVVDYPKLAIRLLAPFVRLPCLNDSAQVVTKREELLAECLLSSSRSETTNVAAAMVQRACELLNFDDQDLDNLMRPLAILDRHIGDDTRLSGMLLSEIKSVIDRMESDVDGSTPKYVSLWSLLFNIALSAHNWDSAHRAACHNPEPGRRVSNFRRLVRAMVDAGAVQELVSTCSSLVSESTAQVHSDIFRRGIDLYGIAAETLMDASGRDFYSVQVVESEPVSDYQGALYALHASQGHWKRAAQSLDLRYTNAKSTLIKGEGGMQLEHGKQLLREGLVVDDLVLASLGCHNAMELVHEADSRFIVSGEYGPYPSTPINLPTSEEKTGTKRSRSFSQSRDSSDVSDESRLSRYMETNRLDARAIRSIALRTLFVDEGAEGYISKADFHGEDSSTATARAIIDVLFLRGYYNQGLMIGKSMSLVRGSLPYGCDLYHDVLSHMLCSYLVPLAVERKLSLARPCISQLLCTLDTFGKVSSFPTLLVGNRSHKISSLHRSSVGLGAMSLLDKLTTTYTTRDNPLAIDVADSLCAAHGNAAPLPFWLERLLLAGTGDETTPGLFARRPTTDSDRYLGDPSALLSLYTKRGMYKQGLDMVAALLSGTYDPSQETKAPSRLPEKGDIDFVPYSKIDVLYSLTNIAIERGDFDDDDMDSVRAVEKSLAKHFSLLKVSEEGHASARAVLG